MSRIRFDAVITDYKMAGESGIEVLRRVRKAGIAYPVVMFTGNSDPSVERTAYDAGATKVFTGELSDFVGHLRDLLAANCN